MPLHATWSAYKFIIISSTVNGNCTCSPNQLSGESSYSQKKKCSESSLFLWSVSHLQRIESNPIPLNVSLVIFIPRQINIFTLLTFPFWCHGLRSFDPKNSNIFLLGIYSLRSLSNGSPIRSAYSMARFLERAGEVH